MGISSSSHVSAGIPPQSQTPTTEKRQAPSMEQVRKGEESFKQGDFGEPVFKLSSLLTSLGFLLAGPPSRSFSPVIEQAVKDFQEARSLKPTGQVDQQTMKEVDTAVSSKEMQNQPTQTATGSSPPQGVAQTQYPFF